MTESANPFHPDWASPPGDTIADLMQERAWSQNELATRLGYSTKHISLLINGKAPVTEETALRLERVLGGPTGFWLAREAQYRAQKARLKAAERFDAWTGWLDKLPVRQIMDAGAIPKRRVDMKSKPKLVEELLTFFGVASPDEWEKHYGRLAGSFRRTRKEQCDEAAISSWLRLGETQAERIDGPRFDRSGFERSLNTIRRLTLLPPEEFEPVLRRLLLESGVVFMVVPSIPRAHVSGVARWLTPLRPLIQLSLYGKTNDKFWFTLFHEIAHLLLHDREEIFLDDIRRPREESEEEQEANAWAGDFLIPPECSSQLRGLKSKADVCGFSSTLGIHPAIVVGRLQHERLISPSWMNDLKVSFSIARSGQ